MSPFIDIQLPGLTPDSVMVTCSQPDCTTTPKNDVLHNLPINCTIIYFNDIDRSESAKSLGRQHLESHQKDGTDPAVVVTAFAHAAHNKWADGSYTTQEAIDKGI